MKRLCALMFSLVGLGVGASLLSALPNASAAGAPHGIAFALVRPDYANLKSTLIRSHNIKVDAIGKVQYRKTPNSRWGQSSYYIVVDGQTFELHPSADKNLLKKLERLQNRFVRVTGTLKTRWVNPFVYVLPSRIPNDNIKPLPAPLPPDRMLPMPPPQPFLVQAIQIASLKAAPGDSTRAEITMEMRGELLVNTRKGNPQTADLKITDIWPHWLRVGNKNYRLLFREGMPLSLALWNGKSVLVRGHIEASTSISPLGRGSLFTTEVFVVREIVVL